MVFAKLPQARLEHILEQIDGIVVAAQGLAFTQVVNNFLYERAVERAVQAKSAERDSNREQAYIKVQPMSFVIY